MTIFDILPLADWLALGSFFALWIGYAFFAHYLGRYRPSLLVATNRYRGYWMRQAAAREPRMLDGIIIQALSQTPSFFSSTSILVVGGLVALLGTSDKATELVSEIPFVQSTSVGIFEFKVLVLIAIFVYAFFRFSWCMRQYTFVAVIIGALPPPAEFESGKFDLNTYADRAAALVAAAAETFHDGLRAYYFSFAALAWFVSPVALCIASLVVTAILYIREFHSDVLAILNG